PRISGSLTVCNRTQESPTRCFQVTGQLSYAPLVDCSRCGDLIAWPIQIEVNVLFTTVVDQESDEHKMDLTESPLQLDDNMETYDLPENGIIDIEALVNDSLMLEIPQQTIRRSENEQSCLVCGKDIDKSRVY